MKKQILGPIILILLIIIILITTIIILYKTTTQEKTDTTENIQTEISTPIIETQEKKVYECNQFTMSNVSDQQMVNIYLVGYLSNAMQELEKAYNSLDEEYREKRFGSFEKYKAYLQENIEEISQATIDRYIINKHDDYTEYIAIDQFDNYYIFKETTVMQYTVQLDMYTIERAEYVEEYTQGESNVKAMSAVKKFIGMINGLDYENTYNLLDTTFRNDKFGNVENFKKHMQENYFRHNKVEITKVDKLGDLYTCTAQIIDQQGKENEKIITKTFIIKLEKNTDFVLSFKI